MNEVVTPRAATPREKLIAKRVKQAEDEKLHPNAVAYAHRYGDQLSMHMLRLISNYETAADSGDRERQRTAWDNVIAFVRTLTN